MKPTPVLSVIVPFFNRRRYLRQAISSLLGEKISPVQIIAIDDGSTDGGAAELADLPVTVLTLPRNQGVAEARNVGVAHAEGEFLFFLDSDDLLSPGALDWGCGELRRHPGWQAVGGRTEKVIDENGEEIVSPVSHAYCHAKRPEILTLDFFVKGMAGGLCLFVMRRDFFLRVGKLDRELGLSEDRDFLIRALRLTSIPLFPRPMIQRRVHESNLAVSYDGKEIHFRKRSKAMNDLVDLAHGVGLKTTNRSL